MASRIKGITVEIGGDTSGLEKSLSTVNNSIKKTQSQLRDVNNLLKLDPSNTILLAQKQELLQSAIGDTEKKLETLEQVQEDVAKAFERGDLGKDQYMAFQREVEEICGALNRYKAVSAYAETETAVSKVNACFGETGEAAKAKRKVTDVKWNKTHSLDHEHILSGILKCPACGSGMAGTVRRRKNKKTGEYKDDFYYRFQHRKKIDEDHFCGFKPSLNQDELNEKLVQIIQDMVAMEKFQDFIQSKLQEKVDVSFLEKEREQVKGKLQQVMGAKKKLVLMLDKLDVNDRHYERKYQDMQERLDNLYDRISELEEMLADVEEKISASCGEQIIGKQIYQFLLEFDKIYRKMTDLEKKEFMRTFIKAIELYPERDDSGRIIKQISFKFPVYYNGCEGDTIRLLNENTVETVVRESLFHLLDGVWIIKCCYIFYGSSQF